MTLSGVFSGSGWPPVSFYVVLLLLSSILSSYFLDLPIHLPLHEQSKWYTVGWILGSIFGLFWHRILYKFLAGVKVMLLLTFLKFVSNFFSNIRYKRDFLLVGVFVTAIFSELIKRESKLEIHLTICWLPPKNALFNQKFSFEWLPITYVELFSKLLAFFSKIKTYFLISQIQKLITVNCLLDWSCLDCYTWGKLEPGLEPGTQNFSQDLFLSTRLISVEISPRRSF